MFTVLATRGDVSLLRNLTNTSARSDQRHLQVAPKNANDTLQSMQDVVGWRRGIILLLLLVAIAGSGLIAAGVFDPRPRGREVWREQLWLQTIPTNSRQILWLDQVALSNAYSLRLIASLRSGENDVGYGLVIGDEAKHLVLAVSPLGYASVWIESGESPDSPGRASTVLLPWQTWPHVRTGHAPNELWIEMEKEQFIIRVNRERLWEGAIAGLDGQVGLFGISFGGPAEVDFDAIDLFAEQD